MTFDRVDINIGFAFDGSSGIFKVPISGTYQMTFSGQSALNKINEINIGVYKNGSLMFGIHDSNKAEKADGNNISYTWMMSLVQGDELKLDSLNYLSAYSDRPLTFTGQLIHTE